MSASSRGSRLLRTTAWLTGLLVLVLSLVSSTVAARGRQVAAQDAELTLLLDQQVDAQANYFERSRAIDLILAHDPVFADFYRAPGTISDKIRAGGPLLRRVNDALGYLEQIYPGRIGEACFIDSSGTEIARVVDGVPAPAAQLSGDESANPFFAPTLALPAGHVHQTQAYESPDTHDPVIANATTVAAAGHIGIVHFEIALESFRTLPGPGDKAVSIVDAHTGETLVDSRQPVSAARSHPFRALTIGAGAEGTTTLGERRVAYRRVPATADNANAWYVMVSAPAFGRGWARGVSVGSLALLGTAVLTMLLAYASWRGHQRSARRAALHDGLTGLPNRANLIDALNRRLQVNTPAEVPTGVLILDLDRFKDVNDIFGEHYGDLLLIDVAHRLSAAAGDDLLVARLGGDEFAVLMSSPGDTDAVALLAGRLRAAVGEPVVVGDVTVHVEASAGAAVAPEHGTTAEDLLRHAEMAVFAAKQHRTGYETYNPATDRDAPDRVALLGELRRALDAENQIVVHYQPKVAVADGRLVGVEALVRWEHPQRGRIAPDAFIPVAENTTLIRTLTTKVLTAAIVQARAWAADGLHIPVAVNLSARCLTDPDLPDQVLSLLIQNAVPPSLLHLEITESAIMTDPHRAMIVLRRLRDAGIQLSLDDFGTGHSSMSYLQRLPVDELKIDRSFIKDIVTNPGDQVLVRSLIDLAHNLKLRVVAEGVEDEQSMDLLRQLGCDVAQGYHLGRPGPASVLDLQHVAMSTH